MKRDHSSLTSKNDQSQSQNDRSTQKLLNQTKKSKFEAELEALQREEIEENESKLNMKTTDKHSAISRLPVTIFGKE